MAKLLKGTEFSELSLHTHPWGNDEVVTAMRALLLHLLCPCYGHNFFIVCLLTPKHESCSLMLRLIITKEMRNRLSVELHVTTMLATSENVLFPDHNHLLTTGTDDPLLAGAWVIIKVSGHQYQWLAGGYDLGIGHF